MATSALGMGYDKADLRFVVHFQAPGSVVSYYQQVGRRRRWSAACSTGAGCEGRPTATPTCTGS